MTQRRLKELVHYDPDTGEFTRLVTTGSRSKKGDVAGSLYSTGYRVIRLDNQRYSAHRLAFLYMTGAFPSSVTDHVNGIESDNRWSNLRSVTVKENARNQKLTGRNTSGVTGVSWSKAKKHWRVMITTNERRVWVGGFPTLAEATAARKAAEVMYGYHENHGRADETL